MAWPCRVGGLFNFPLSRYFTGSLFSPWIFWQPCYWHDVSLHYYQQKPLNHLHKSYCYSTFTWSLLKFSSVPHYRTWPLALVKYTCSSYQVIKIFLQTDCSGSITQSCPRERCSIHKLTRLLSVSSSKLIRKNVKQDTTKTRTLYYLGTILRWH